jgi:hypothetical protein
LKGGPERSSGNCGAQINHGRTFANFYGALVKSLRRRAQAYVVAWQYYSPAFQTTNTWENATAAGFVQPIGKFSIEGAAGYFHGDPLLAATEPLQGYFVAPRLGVKLTEHSSLSVGYRAVHPTGGNTVLGNLNSVMMSLDWHPKPFQFGR